MNINGNLAEAIKTSIKTQNNELAIKLMENSTDRLNMSSEYLFVILYLINLDCNNQSKFSNYEIPLRKWRSF
jgi:hypothetical protein